MLRQELSPVCFSGDHVPLQCFQLGEGEEGSTASDPGGTVSLPCCVLCGAHSVLSDSLQPHGLPGSMGFSKQEYWSGLPFSSPADLPNLGIETVSLVVSALAGRFFITSATRESLASPERIEIRFYIC